MRFAMAAAVMSLALSVAAQKEMHMVHAKGSFDIKMTPAEPTDFEKANDITRFTSDKTWHGDFEGVSHGEMITGSLIIHIDAQGKHTWTFDYSLPYTSKTIR